MSSSVIANPERNTSELWSEAELVAHVGEVELRRLFAQEACSSMF
jgi:hypothetical protein